MSELSVSSVDEESESIPKPSTKKRKSHGRVRDVMKRLKVCTHETGPDCRCKRLRCFDRVLEGERKRLLSHFNALDSTDTQSTYLAGLINVNEIKNRRSRKPENESSFNDKSYTYRVRIKDGDSFIDTPVCYKAFLSIFGITGRRVQSIQKSLKENGEPPSDQRGKYDLKHCRTPDEVRQSVIDHIASFKGRKSHYSFDKTKKTYLPDTLNLKKMYTLYKTGRPNVRIVSYEYYRKIFVSNFNISFGYPRSDTCSACDRFQAEIKALNLQLEQNNDEQGKATILNSINTKKIENEIHLRKANMFYDTKRKFRKISRKREDTEALTIDFQKKLSLPNLTTNDVYYRRQLSFYLFNVHSLSTGNATFFSYPEIEGGKGADEVVSMLHYYIFNMLNPSVKNLYIFCDSCSGQNKNYTMFRFCHYVVQILKKLDCITIIFPIRGHSYLECDRDMALINGKYPAEMPEHWITEIKNARIKPSPFTVVEADLNLFRKWTVYLENYYHKKCPFATRPIREIKFSKDHCRLVEHRASYTGYFVMSPILTKHQLIRLTTETEDPGENSFCLPPRLREDLIKLKPGKYQDLQHLKQFCSPLAQKYLEELPH